MDLRPDEHVVLELTAAPGSQWTHYLFTLGGWEYARRRRRWYLTNQRVLFMKSSRLKWSVPIDQIVAIDADQFNAVMANRWLALVLIVRDEDGRTRYRNTDHLKRADAELFREKLSALVDERTGGDSDT